MPTPVKLFISLTVTAAVLWSQNLSATASRATEGSPIRKRPQLVTLNIVAFDSQGKPVGDLTSDDFQIEDQGKRQQIAFFRRNESKPPQRQVAVTPEYSNRLGASVQQATVIILDLLNARLSDRGSGWEGVNGALEHIQSANNLYLYLLTADGRLFPIQGIPNSETDRPPASRLWTQQIRTLMDQAMGTVNRLRPIEDGDPGSRTRVTYQVLAQLALQLTVIPGRKNVVWITRGLPMSVRLYNNDMQDLSGNLRKLSLVMNQWGVAMYPVDQNEIGPSTVERHVFLEELAGLTGGHAYSSNHVETAVAAATASERGSFLILYDPQAGNWDGKFHKIRVNCKRKGIRIHAQVGYYAIPAGMGDNPLRERFEAAAANPIDASGIGLRATVVSSPDVPHTLHYELHIDPADLLLTHQGDRDHSQLVIGFIGIADGRVESPGTAVMEVSLTKEQLAIAMQEGIPFVHDKVIANGVQKVRIVVMDTGSAEIGTLTVPAS